MLPMLPPDKAAHLLYGYAAAATAFVGAWFYGLRSMGALLLCGVLAALAVGLAKEARDIVQRGRERAAGAPPTATPEFADLLATLGGSLLFALPLLLLRGLFQWGAS